MRRWWWWWLWGWGELVGRGLRGEREGESEEEEEEMDGGGRRDVRKQRVEGVFYGAIGREPKGKRRRIEL